MRRDFHAATGKLIAYAQSKVAPPLSGNERTFTMEMGSTWAT